GAEMYADQVAAVLGRELVEVDLVHARGAHDHEPERSVRIVSAMPRRLTPTPYAARETPQGRILDGSRCEGDDEGIDGQGDGAAARSEPRADVAQDHVQQVQVRHLFEHRHDATREQLGPWFGHRWVPGQGHGIIENGRSDVTAGEAKPWGKLDQLGCER